MATYSVKELDDMVADQINSLVQHGFKIDRDSSFCNNSLFKAVLKREFPQPITVTIRTLNQRDSYAKVVYVSCPSLPELSYHKCYNYHLVKDNLFTDDK